MLGLCLTWGVAFGSGSEGELNTTTVLTLPAGALDPGFGENGVAVPGAPGLGWDYPRATGIGPDGKIYVVGGRYEWSESQGSQQLGYLRKFKSNGFVESSVFTLNSERQYQYNDLAFQPGPPGSGTTYVIIAGYWMDGNHTDSPLLHRYDASTLKPDSEFINQTTFTLTTGRFYQGVVVDESASDPGEPNIVPAGGASTSGKTESWISGYTVDGTPVTSFIENGQTMTTSSTVNRWYNDVALAGSGVPTHGARYLCVGTGMDTADYTRRGILDGFDADGMPNADFNYNTGSFTSASSNFYYEGVATQWGTVSTTTPHIVVVGGTGYESDGTPLVHGYDINGNAMTGFNSNASQAVTDALGGKYGGFSGVTVQSDGKIVAVGSLAKGGGATDAMIMRFNRDGTSDESFWKHGLRVLGFDSTVVVGDAGTVLLSSEVDAWEADTSGSTFNLNGVAYFVKGHLGENASIIAVGNNGVILSSKDGKTWIPQSSGVIADLNGIAAGSVDAPDPTTYAVAVGENGTIVSTSDVMTWTSKNKPVSLEPEQQTWTLRTAETTSNLNAVANLYPAAGSGFMAVGDAGTILTSSDVITWTAQTAVTSNNLHGLAGRYGSYVVVGENGTILSSSDGSNWVVQTLDPPTNLYGIDQGNGLFVAVGDSGAVYTSSDGSSWSPQSSGIAERLEALAYTGAGFIAVGSSGAIYASETGSTWARQTSNTTQGLKSIVHILRRSYARGVALDARGKIVISGGIKDALFLARLLGQEGTTPTAGFTATPTSGAPPLKVVFSDQSTGDVESRQWKFGDGKTSTSRNPTHTYDKAGEYTVTLTVKGLGETSVMTREKVVTVYTAPVAAFSANPVSGKTSLTVEFTDQSKGTISSRNWDFGDGASSTEKSPSHVYSKSGKYTVKLTVKGPGGQDTETKERYITVYAPPVADFSATPTSGKAPLKVQFTDKSTGDVTSWKWTFGDGTQSTARNPSHTYQKGGTYTVGLTSKGPAGTSTKTKTGWIKATRP